MNSEGKINKLVKALEDEDGRIRNNAAASLGKIGKPAFEPLVRLLENENENKNENFKNHQK
ncbi:MAG: HEAT repeat domain-containing protein [Bacteroidales bacterium]|nr:HEAT repeat domain-containing protein [Bacteroidales bacterium]